ncbi:MAG: helix-turn-helix domain-containing protein [Methylobacterium sp.]|uniref:helix-turn-helix domain-containing protein n=1 Tax=Methylobacterium sp. TaxID=409 RepID=UPI0025DF6625|nr:helix-turn-helix domain-containing protein [Methylobacterium sp.]MBX9934697.1 helix-turn-helix domain-containing protein [Methylobacterium sp.]
MFADEIRRAIEAADRITLPSVTALLWRAYGEGRVTEAEAEVLSSLIEARTEALAARRVSLAAPAASNRGDSQPARDTATSTRRTVGSRPRTDASMERRRRWAASGRLPPGLAARFTLAEQAVLSLVAAETVRRKDCRLAVGNLAAVVGVAETTVRNAIREAVKLGLVTVEERRVTGFRNDTNIVRIVAAEWTAWLRLAKGRREGAITPPPWEAARADGSVDQGGGCKTAKGTPTGSSSPVNSVDRNRGRAAGRQGRRQAGATSG